MAEEGACATRSSAKNLYDALDMLWINLYGHHVHVGFYPDPADKSSVIFRHAQERTIEQLISVAGLGKGVEQVLDIGCGVGGTAVHLAQKLGCNALGVNISSSQVTTANAFAAEQGLPPAQVRFVEGDALNLPDSVGPADVVLSFESAAYMPDKRRFIQQMASRVRHGGKLVILDFCRGPEKLSAAQVGYLKQLEGLFATASDDWHSMAEYEAMLATEGLEVVSLTDWTQHIKGFWEAGLVELFTPEPEEAAKGAANIAKLVCAKIVRVCYLALAGGWPTLKMSWTYITSQQQRVMRGAFGSGALRYQALVAVRK